MFLINFSYGDLVPITPLGRALTCLAAIYGISIVSMLVSVLADRYQRVYKRKHYLNEEYAEKIIFDDTPPQLKTIDEHVQSFIDTENEFHGISKSVDEIYHREQDKDERSGKVRFIIGYISDEESDNNQDKSDGDENKFINKVAQELFQLQSNKYKSLSEDNILL